MRKVPPALAERLYPAARVFAELGYDDARIEDLTEATGVASSTLYYYFEGKRDVLVFLLQDVLERVASAVDEAGQSTGNARERLEHVIRAQLRLMTEQPDTCKVLLAELGRITRLPDLAKAVDEAFLEPVRRLLDDGAADGSLRALPRETAATAIFGAVTVVGLHYVVADTPISADNVAESVLALLEGGYANTSTSRRRGTKV
jgi:AcrR family transcriptional regulator